MGIMRWKDGLIVTAPPKVLYLEDSDGDGRADVERVLLTGFHEGDGESDVNNPVYGLDNGIYLANGPRSGNEIAFADRPEGIRLPPDDGNRNVRFRPDTYELEAQSGRSQFGLTFDRWGHPLYNSNRNHVYEEVIAARYLARNPQLIVSGATTSVSDHGAATQVFPITTDPEYQILTEIGEITSACGITYYDGGIFPDAFDQVSFTAEPAHNLVHVDRIERTGPALSAARIRPHHEFLASTDAAFRPVNMYVGPDGALYVVDYYRQIIEGPEWISDEVLESRDLYEGTESGRIYRVTPRGTPPADWTAGLGLGQATNAELVAHLSDPNIWWRRNAQRMLVDRGAADSVPALEAAARGTSAVGRLHALWTLHGIGRLDADLLREVLEDEEPGVRENAVRLAEGHLDELQEALLAMESDPDPKVRFQLLLTLGFVHTPAAAQVREELLFGDINDEWTQVAALSAPAVQEGDVLETIVERYQPEYASFVHRLSALAAVHRSHERIGTLVRDAVAADEEAPWQAPVLEGLAQGLGDRELSENLPLDEVVAAFLEHPAGPTRTAALALLETTGLPVASDEAVGWAAEIAGDADAAAERRVEAIEFLTLDDPARHAALMMDLIDPATPAVVQAAAFHALGAAPGTTVSTYAMERWPLLTHEVRDAALDAVLVRPFQLDRIRVLLDGLEAGTVQPASIGWGDQVTLMRDIPDDMKRRARALITVPQEEARREAASYVQEVRARTPDPAQGRAVFFQACASCHGLGDVAPGSNVGPDLMSVRGWTTPDLIDQIVQPSKAISRGYELWQLTLENGETVEGMIASETANAVTIRDANGQEATFARRGIEALNNLNASAMPSNFGETLTHQQMADLVAFIRVGE
jgi:putative membrane-bound dehydrogenase-like protein